MRSAFDLKISLRVGGIAGTRVLLVLIFPYQLEGIHFFDRTELIFLDLTLNFVNFMPHLLYPPLDDHMSLALLVVHLVQTFELPPE
jgi:hypothetical protein